MLKKTWPLAIPIAGLAVFAIISSNASSQPSGAPIAGAQIVSSYPHDRDAFTQGLVVEGDVLYEGTGQYGQSTLRRVDLKTGKVLQSVPLHQRYFGEGIAMFGDRIYQLTWKERICVVYDKATLKPLGSLPYKENHQGWGLTADEEHLYLSDGSNVIRVLDPQNLRVIRRIQVKEGSRRIRELNELEFVEGELLANIWYRDQIARIDPNTGTVTGWIDCSSIYPASQRPSREHVLNGIAYDAEAKKLYVTGKNWPQLYEIRF